MTTLSPVTHGRLLRLAGPIIIANLSIPLLGLADMIIIGRLADPVALGAVAMAGTIFNFVYYGFGFLRMGTTGLTAQSLGARDDPEISAHLGRALLIAAGIGLGLILLQWPIATLSLYLMQGSEGVSSLAHDFIAIRIWSAPFALMNFALTGWFIGRQKAKTALTLQLFMNALNIALNVSFVVGLDWGVKGVAFGTMLAEITAALLGLVIAYRNLRDGNALIHWTRARLMEPRELARMIVLNRDILLRTYCLIFVFSFFTAQGARAGDITLAANAVLGQFIALSAFLLDAFCAASEALVGEAVGARDRDSFYRSITLSALWAGGAATMLSLFVWFAGPALIDLLTASSDVRIEARTYLIWSAMTPVLAVWCFLLDGIFIGATRSSEMRNAMALSLVIFLGDWWALTPAFGNHGLWASLVIFYVARSLTLMIYFRSAVSAALTYR